MGYVRHELGRRLRIRRIPELHVRLDDSAETATRVLHVLNELEAGTDPHEIAPFDGVAARRRSSGCPTRATPTTRRPPRRRPATPEAAAAARAPRQARRRAGGHAPKGRGGKPSAGKSSRAGRRASRSHRHG